MTLSLYAMVLPQPFIYPRRIRIGRRDATSVRGPLHGGEIDAVLVHLPQRRQRAQLVDLAADQLDREVDLALGGEAADGEADRAVRELVAAAKRAQHVRRLERCRRARRARRHGEVLDRHDEALALDEIEADVEVVRNAMLEAAVDVDFLDSGQPVPQPVAQLADAGQLLAHLEAREAERLAHA